MKLQPQKKVAGLADKTFFDPNKYMLKLPKNKKVKLSIGQIKWEKVETDYFRWCHG